jgi:hypothetical protein
LTLYNKLVLGMVSCRPQSRHGALSLTCASFSSTSLGFSLSSMPLSPAAVPIS